MNDEKRFSASTPTEYSSQHPIFSLGQFKFGYGKNNEVQLSVWWPCDLEEGEAGLETLDIEAVLLYSLHYKLKRICRR